MTRCLALSLWDMVAPFMLKIHKYVFRLCLQDQLNQNNDAVKRYKSLLLGSCCRLAKEVFILILLFMYLFV